LIRHSGLVGRTSVLFIGVGEKFDLGWGPDLAIRMHRSEETLSTESKMLSSWSTSPKRVELKVSNIGPEKKSFEIKERVPVSEVEKVEILFDAKKTTGTAKADENGFVCWPVTLDGFERDTIKLAYSVKRHSDVVGL
jgi:hypothetical protein